VRRIGGGEKGGPNENFRERKSGGGGEDVPVRKKELEARGGRKTRIGYSEAPKQHTEPEVVTGPKKEGMKSQKNENGE